MKKRFGQVLLPGSVTADLVVADAAAVVAAAKLADCAVFQSAVLLIADGQLPALPAFTGQMSYFSIISDTVLLMHKLHRSMTVQHSFGS